MSRPASPLDSGPFWASRSSCGSIARGGAGATGSCTSCSPAPSRPRDAIEISTARHGAEPRGRRRLEAMPFG